MTSLMKAALLGVLALILSVQARAQVPAVAPAAAPASTATTPAPAVATPTATPAAAISAPTGRALPPLPPEKLAPVRVPRFEARPVVDGVLDEEVWKQAVVLKDFYQINPGDNIEPTAPTEVLLGYDAKHLYVAFRAYDDKSKIRATVARRDNVFDQDNVRLLLDTFNDQRRAYVLGFNPFGIQQDGIMTEGAGTDYSVDIVMESKGKVIEDGYVVEIAIPFKSLRYEAGKGKVWGLHVWRNIDRNSDEIDSWMPISRENTGTLNQAGRITGLEDLSLERTIEIIPSLTLSETGRRVRTGAPAPDAGRLVNEPIDFEPGLTARFVASSAMTLDLAVNPDFAQVEADQLVVTSNQRFPIFFAERRPFFLEGIEIFNTALTAVHTRAIVDPDLALKLTGKRGRNTYGVIFASDNGPGNLSRDERAFVADERNAGARRDSLLKLLDRNATIGVLRLKRDLGRENNLGVVATTYNFIDHHSHAAGVDGRFRLDKQTTLSFNLLGTNAKTPFFDPHEGATRDEARAGLGYAATYFKQGRNWGLELYGEGRTQHYRADVGFTPRTNTNFNSSWVSYDSDQKPKAKIVRYHLHNFTHINYDFQGRMQIWESEMNVQWFFQHNANFGLGYEYAYERLFEEEFGATREAVARSTARSFGAEVAARTPCDSRGTLPAPDPARPNTRIRLCTFYGEDTERSSSKNHYFLFGGIRPSKKFSVNARFVYRDGHFDFDFGSGRRFPRVSPAALALGQNAPRDPGVGALVEGSLAIRLQPTDKLLTTLNYTKNRLRRYDTDRVAFDVNLVSWRTTYQFTRFLFARARLDFETLPKRARGQFLFGWTPNPGTSFYLGYNDDVTVSGFHRFNGQFDPGLRRYERQFFIKAAYLFRRSF
jgi:hypothetical protein